MRIAVISQGADTILPPRQNSVGLCTYSLASHLARNQDNKVLAFGRGRWRSAPESADADGADLRVLPSGFIDTVLYRGYGHYIALLHKIGMGRLAKPFSTSLWAFPMHNRKVARSLRKERPDVVHIQHSLQFAPLYHRILPDARIVGHLHSVWIQGTKGRSVRRQLKSLDGVLGVSSFVSDDFRQLFPSYPGTVAALYDGIDEAESGAVSPRAADDGLKVLYVGHVSPHKGVHDALDAFVKIADDHPNARFDICGPPGAYPFIEVAPSRDPDSEIRLSPFYKENGVLLPQDEVTRRYLTLLESKIPPHLKSRVVLRGHLTRAEIVQHFHEADVFLFTPVWNEGYGMPVVEAMAAKTPVVVTRSGATTETVLDGVTGFLADKGDVSAIAGALDQLLSDTGLRRNMGEAAQRDALDRFTWAGIAMEAERLYSQLGFVQMGHGPKPTWASGHDSLSRTMVPRG